jgi:hypothetical protein
MPSQQKLLLGLQHIIHGPVICNCFLCSQCSSVCADRSGGGMKEGHTPTAQPGARQASDKTHTTVCVAAWLSGVHPVSL